MPSTLERWTGSAWSNEANLVRFELTDKQYAPMLLSAIVADPLNTIQSNYGDYTKLRIIEGTTGRIIFYGKVVDVDSTFDNAYGQIIRLKARDNLQELLMRTNNTNYTGDVKRGELIADIVDDHTFTANSIPNIATETTQKYIASAITESSGVLDTNFSDSGINTLRSIFEIASEEPHDANATGFGSVFYLDHEFNGNNATPDMHFFRRGDRPGDLADNSGGDANTYGLTVELEGTQGNQDRAMFADYTFPQLPKELVTKVSIQYVTSTGESTSLPVILVNHGAVTGGSFAVGDIITWTGSGSAKVELVNDSAPRYLLLGPDSVGSTAYLADISGATITATGDSDSAAVNATSATPPGSMRETIQQDVEATLSNYGIEHLDEARTRAAQVLFNGGDSITRGEFTIQNWPYIERSGVGLDHDGPANSATLIHSAGNFLRYGLRQGDIIENLTDASSGTITAIVNGSGTITATLSGGTDNDWDAGDLYRYHVMTRAGHIIRVKNSNQSIDADMVVTQIIYEEGPGIAWAKIEVLGNTTTRGGGPPVGTVKNLKNNVETASWQTVAASGGVPGSSQLANLDFVFTSAAYNVITWAGGTATFIDGHTVTIGTTGSTFTIPNDNIHYISFADDDSATQQLTISSTFPTGISNVIAAICIRNRDANATSSMIVSSNSGSPSIAANTLIANELSAISATMGLLTAGAIRLPSSAANVVSTSGFTGITINGDRLAGYASGVLTIQLDSADGILKSGATGAVQIDQTGIKLTNSDAESVPTISAQETRIDFINDGSTASAGSVAQNAQGLHIYSNSDIVLDATNTANDILVYADTFNMKLNDIYAVGVLSHVMQSYTQLAVIESTGNIADDTYGGGTTGSPGTLLFREGDGTDLITIKAPQTIAASYSLTLPTTNGNANEMLITNGSGVTSWVAQPSARVATGSYTGDGSTSLAITGVGFAPKYIVISERYTTATTQNEGDVIWTTDVIIDDNASGMAMKFLGGGNGHQTLINAIISLDSDGFTVDDAGLDNDPNKNSIVYNYYCTG